MTGLLLPILKTLYGALLLDISGKLLFHFLLFFFSLSYFIFGFIVGENSAGAGGYDGDFKLIWNNLQILREGIILNLNNPDYSDSRPPLSYILHILVNPFIDNQESYRSSVFIISLLVPVLLFFSVKEKFKQINNYLTIRNH